VSVGFDRETESPCKTEVRKFYILAVCVNQQILRFQISMENPVLVQMDKRLKNLVEEALCLLSGKRGVPLRAHVLLQIELQILKYKVKLLLAVDNFFQSTKSSITLLTRQYLDA
jgi:hypothetical protein